MRAASSLTNLRPHFEHQRRRFSSPAGPGFEAGGDFPPPAASPFGDEEGEDVIGPWSDVLGGLA
jgi:hypothetical protein